jgi:substrate import-associated zinc metallohydrolase lipoprotein
MNMNIKLNGLCLFAAILLMTGACKDPYNSELDESKLNFATNDRPASTPLDNWLFDNFTAPYNIEVKYRWDAGELDVNKTLVPPIPDRVFSIMNVVKDAWITPYMNEAGATFFQTICTCW